MLFRSHLCGMEMEYLKLNDNDRLNKIQNAQEKFLNEHLKNWPFALRDEVAKKDENGFYTAILDYTIGWIELETSE